MMKPSDEFFYFCSGLHQDFDLYGSKPEDWIDGALGFVSKDRLPTLRDYIVSMLTSGYSDSELQAVYRSTPTELRIWDDRGVRPFLEMVRDRIDRKMPV
jgi:hypothetical protein